MQLSETLEGWVIDLGKCIPWDDPAQLKAENSRLKLQLEKVLEAFSVDADIPCPSNVGLQDSYECGIGAECPQCWRDALQAVGEETTQ